MNEDRSNQYQSPQSNTSSFRDYVHPSPSSPQLSIGFRNFYLSKCMRKLSHSLLETEYWQLFDSFKMIKSIGLQLQTYQRISMRRLQMKQILIHRGSDAMHQKLDVIEHLSSNTAEGRMREIQIGVKFGVIFIRVGYVALASAFGKIKGSADERLKHKEQQLLHQLERKEAKTRATLSKAVMTVVLRNFINKKLMKVLEQFKFRVRLSANDKSKKMARSKSKGKLSQLIPIHPNAHSKKKDTHLQKTTAAYKINQIIRSVCFKKLSSWFRLLAQFNNNNDDSIIFTSILSHVQYLCHVNANKPQRKNIQNAYRPIQTDQISKQAENKIELANAFKRWRVKAIEVKMPIVRRIIELQEIKRRYVEDEMDSDAD